MPYGLDSYNNWGAADPNAMLYSIAGGAAGGGGGGAPAPAPQTPPWWSPSQGTLNNILMGTAGGMGMAGAAGAAQNLFGRPQSISTRVRPSPGQLGSLASAEGQLGQGQAFQAMLAQALQNPQLPPGLANLAAQAFQPAAGDALMQGIMHNRRSGFLGGPSGDMSNLLAGAPGSRISGQMMAALQPQMAAAQLSLYQNYINNLMQAIQGSGQLAQGYRGTATAFPAETRQRAPQPSILDTIGQIMPLLGSMGSILGKINF